jgi:hypothetical protein
MQEAICLSRTEHRRGGSVDRRVEGWPPAHPHRPVPLVERQDEAFVEDPASRGARSPILVAQAVVSHHGSLHVKSGGHLHYSFVISGLGRVGLLDSIARRIVWMDHDSDRGSIGEREA